MPQRISKKDSKSVANLSNKIGEKTLRQILSPEGGRLISRRRLANLESGSGKLTEAEQARLRSAAGNTRKIQTLKATNQSKRDYRVNRAIASWVQHGKTEDVEWSSLSGAEKEDGMKAIKALAFLQVDVTEKKYYLNTGGKESGE